MINPEEHPHSPAENISLNKESLQNTQNNIDCDTTDITAYN
jgi:hypothetical protein